MDQKWPSKIWIIRHGQSAGNVARDLAYEQGLPHIGLAVRDAEVPLSELGERQAGAVGEWFLKSDEKPTIVLSSPYIRAKNTAEIIMNVAGFDAENYLITDERLREREFGILDGLTNIGIEQLYPEQAKMRAALGKFYHRPPGGESWCDVILRLRSFLDTMIREYKNERVLIVAHTVVVMGFRYLLERMDESEILEVDRNHELANCSVTSYMYDRNKGKNGKLISEKFNYVIPLIEAGEPVTNEPDAPVAPK